jgi:hypothetical protein
MSLSRAAFGHPSSISVVNAGINCQYLLSSSAIVQGDRPMPTRNVVLTDRQERTKRGLDTQLRHIRRVDYL